MKQELQDQHQNWCQQILKALFQANSTLKSKGIRLRICIIGNRLHLRGKFPPKPFSKRKTDHQQPLALGYYVTNENPQQSIRNIKQAGTDAVYIYHLILSGKFDWSQYMMHHKKHREFLELQEKAEKEKAEKNKKTTFRELLNKFKTNFLEYSKADNKDDRWKILERELEYLESDDEFSLILFEAKALEFIKKKSTSATKKTAQRASQQFINFIKIEGFYEETNHA